MATEQKDVIRVFDTPANLSANLEDKMIGGDITNDRFAGKFPTNTMRFVSHDGKQCLLATNQTLTGIKSFSALLNALAGIDLSTVFSTKPTSQAVTTDNDTLLSVAATSFLIVSTSTTSTPTGFTVGLEAGARDGHIVRIAAKSDLSAFEINDSVAGSATIEPKTAAMPLVVQVFTSGGPNTRSFIWDDTDSTWFEL